MKTKAECEHYLRHVRVLLAGPDMPNKPTAAMRGEEAVLEWVLGLRDDPPDLDKTEFLEKILSMTSGGSGAKE